MSKYIKWKDLYNALDRAEIRVYDKETAEGIARVLEETRQKIINIPTIEVSEDAISREHTLKIINAMREADKDNAVVYGKVYSQIKDAPSVIPKPKEGECPYFIDGVWCNLVGKKMKGADDDED